MPAEDALGYVRLADNLVHRNTLAVAAVTTEPSPFFPPLYPGFLAAIAFVDERFRTLLACVGALEFNPIENTCVLEFGSAIYIHIGLSALTLTLIWISAFVIFRSTVVAAISVVFAWGTGRFSEVAVIFLTENIYLPCFAAASLMLLLAVRDNRFWQFIGCGVAIGLAALTRPSAQYASYAILFILVATGVSAYLSCKSTKVLVGTMLFVVAYCGTILPWMVRNHLQFDHMALTKGYASKILVERLSYNRMTWSEFAITPLYWLPGPGEALAKQLFDEVDYRRLGFSAEDSFYRTGVGRDRAELAGMFSNEADRMTHLLEDRLMNEPVKHILVTAALSYRGMWIVKYWSLVAAPTMLFLFARCFWNRSWREFAIFLLPGLFMLVFHATITSNVHRYNLKLIPGMALSCGWLVVRLFDMCGISARLSRRIDNVKLRAD